MAKLTQNTLNRSKVPKGKRLELWDDTVPGLHARVSLSRGRRRIAFYLRYRVPGAEDGQTVQRRHKIGEFPAVPLADQEDGTKGARTLAREFKAQVAAGVDPKAKLKDDAREAAKERARKMTHTFKALAEAYLASQREHGVESVDETERQLSKDFYPTLGDIQVEDVTPEAISEILKAVKGRGAKVMANRLRSLLIAIYRWGQRDEVWRHVTPSANPAEATNRPYKGEKPRRGALTDKQLKALFEAALNVPTKDGRLQRRARLDEGKLDPVVSAAFRLRVLTGQRWTEIIKARWTDIRNAKITVDGERQTVTVWKIPAPNTKTKERDHLVPLGAEAKGVLYDLAFLKWGDTTWWAQSSDPMGELFDAGGEGLKGADSLVFPSYRKPGESIGRANHSFRVWKRRGGVPSMIGKDLRHTVVTGMARSGVQPWVRSLCMNHAPRTVTDEVYNEWDHLAEKLAAFETWEQHVRLVVTGDEVLDGRERFRAEQGA